MFAACILFALPTIKGEWVASDSHPVYNSRVQAVPLGGWLEFVVPPGGTDDFIRPFPSGSLEIFANHFALYRSLAETASERIATELKKPNPSKEIINEQTNIRDRSLDVLRANADALRDYPELEGMIEASVAKTKKLLGSKEIKRMIESELFKLNNQRD